ncbi:MAG: alpha/beta hydrolase [Dehalococcoidia bacterium]
MTTTGATIVLEPAAQAFLDSLAAAGGPPIYTLPIEEARKVFNSLQATNIDKLPVDIEDRTIPGGPNGEVSIRILRPQQAPATLPVVLYIHGAGWVFGDTNTHDRLVRELAVGAQAAVVFVNFTRSPEARYPTAIEQAHAAAVWVAEHGTEIGLDGARMAVAGDSVGGNMTIAVTMLAKQRGGPVFRQQVLFYPVTNAAFDTGSYNEFADGYFLTREAMKWFWDNYAPDESVRSEPTVSPLRATTEQLAGLPPALVINGQADVLRDEGEAYAAKLRAAGVSVTAVRFQGMVHDFVMLHALAHSNAARAAFTQATATLRAAFAGGD